MRVNGGVPTPVKDLWGGISDPQGQINGIISGSVPQRCFRSEAEPLEYDKGLLYTHR